MSERKPSVRPTVPMIRRMQQLRRAGLSAAAVRVVLEVDYGASPEEATIRKYTSDWSAHAQSFADTRPLGRAGITAGPMGGRAA